MIPNAARKMFPDLHLMFCGCALAHWLPISSRVFMNQNLAPLDDLMDTIRMEISIIINDELLQRVHSYFLDRLAYSC